MLVDTSALVAIMDNEPERRCFNELIEAASATYVSTTNLLETRIVLFARSGDNAVLALDAFLLRNGMIVADVRGSGRGNTSDRDANRRTTPRQRQFPPGIPHLWCVADHSDLNGFRCSFEFTGWTSDEKGRPVGIFRYGTASDVYTKSEDEWTWKWSEKRVLASCYVCSENGTFTSYIFDSSSAVAGCCTYLCRHFERLATEAKS